MSLVEINTIQDNKLASLTKRDAISSVRWRKK